MPASSSKLPFRTAVCRWKGAGGGKKFQCRGKILARLVPGDVESRRCAYEDEDEGPVLAGMVVTADEEDAEDEEEKEEKDEKEEEGEELRRWLDHTGSMPYNNASPEEGILNDGGLSAKLKCPASISRLRVEKIEGGLMVAGVVVAANCQIALPAFGFLFVLVGAVLTAASYRGPGEDEDKDSYAARIAFTGNSRILGPICIVVGALMFGLGALLCALTRRARRRERRVGFHCPLHGDFYPLSPAQGAKMIGKNVGGWTKIPCFRGRASLGSDSKLGARSGPPQCPHSVLSSTRSSVSSSPLSPCPTPMPFLVTSGSMSSGMVQISAGTNLSPDQTFGSIRSLSVTREVASFPLSRTPTPPPQHRSLSNSISTKHEETSPDSQSRGTPKSEVRDVIAAQRQDSPSPAERAAQPSRKSVSIVLPDESLG